MIIDSHNHPDWHGHNLQRFLANMEEHKIDVTWLLTWECPEDEYDPANYVGMNLRGVDGGPIAFSRALHYIEQAPDKFVLGWAPDPRKADSIDRLGAAIDIYGVRVYGELKLRMMFDDLDAIRMYRFCGEKGLPVVVHIDYPIDFGVKYPRPNYWYGGGIEPFERAVAQCPDSIFLGHGPGFWAHMSGDDQADKVYYPEGDILPGGKLPEMMRKYLNLYADMSAGSGHNALTRNRDFGREFLIEFQDNVLYARDYFDAVHREFLDSIDLPAEVLDKINSGNALKLVPL